ncbi:MAG: hypothetical protein CO164_12150 [Rhodocyclales bacterium CG_4_9_14_3_um_filter_68_10]|nr:MAG: hypothetical protein CO164_12150 [Rhodocyclales bacterium CG_4_9_14_3_um_filter_68_10]
MRTASVLVASTLLALPGIGAAQSTAPAASPHSFTGNFTLASEYIYRGIGQTNREPAVQGGFDYAHASGFYVGIWASNISWLSDTAGGGVSAPFEVDLYGGYKNSFAGGDWNYDLGVLRYNYPGTFPPGFVDPDTTEVYASIGWKWLSAKYSYAVSSHLFGFTGTSGENTRGSDYLELNAAYDLGGGWGLAGHVGHQKVDGNGDASYTDYKIGLTKDVGIGTVGVAYWATNANGCGDTPPTYCNAFNKDLGEGRVLATFSKTF